MRISLLLISFFSICNIYAQERSIETIDSIYSLKISAKEKLVVANNFLNSISPKSSKKELGHIHHKVGLLHNKLANYEKAIAHTLKAIAYKKDSNTSLRSLNNSRSNIYQYHKMLGKESQGLQFLVEVINSHSHDKFVCKSYIDFSIFHRERGDYFTALEYLKLVTDFDACKDKEMQRRAHLESILVYRRMDNPQLYLNQIEGHKIILQKNSKPLDLGSLYNSLGLLFFDISDYQNAIESFQKALIVYKELENSEKIGILYNNLGNCYANLNKVAIANEYYEKALAMMPNKNTLADVHNNLGYYLDTRNVLDKIPYYEKALCLILDISDENCNSNQLISFEKIKKASKEYWDDILFYLTNLARTWMEGYYEHPEENYLLRAKENLHLIDKLVSLVREDSTTDKSKLFWINQGVDVYMLAVEVCFLLQNKDEGFYFMERNKALLLLENLDETVLRAYRSIPEPLKKIEDELEGKLLKIGKEIQESPNDISLRRNLLMINHELFEFKDSLELSYPVLDKMKDQGVTSLSENLKEHVNDETNFVEYILSENKGFGLFSSSEGVQFFQIESPGNLLEDVVSVKKMMSMPFKVKSDFVEYQEKAKRVFESLFPFTNAKSLLSNKQLKVVSDYVLHGLPFSALVITENEDPTELDYLLYHSEVTYLQSAAIYNRIGNEESNGGVIGFSPTSFARYNMPDLLESEFGMKEYSSFLSMELMLREDASKENFLRSLEQNNSIVHINSHAGLSEDKTPWIALFNGTLSLEEIYNLTIKTKHVILDACQTGSGENLEGEGIISLSRAFFYGGVESVIASQWNMNERSNNQILGKYYKALLGGQDKSSALASAKRYYIMNNEFSQTSPYYWASLTLTGASESLVLKGRGSFWWFLTFPVLIVCILVVKNFFRKASFGN